MAKEKGQELAVRETVNPALSEAGFTMPDPETAQRIRDALMERAPAQQAELDQLYGEQAAIPDDILAVIDTAQDALSLFSPEDLDALEDYGAGFEVVDKDTLVNTPMVLLQWVFRYGKQFGSAMVTVFAVTNTGQKVIFNDGSETGIRKQLEEVTTVRVRKDHANPRAGLIVKRGLRRDEFPRYMRDPQTNEFLFAEDGSRIAVTNPDGSPAIGHVYRFA